MKSGMDNYSKKPRYRTLHKVYSMMRRHGFDWCLIDMKLRRCSVLINCLECMMEHRRRYGHEIH